MKRIKLTQGLFAIVDDADYKELSKYKWFVHNQNGNFYAMRNSSIIAGRLISMARQILGLEYGDPRQADHIQHNTLDNRRKKLRICTQRENLMNQKPQKGKSSSFKGVSWNRFAKKWSSYIQLNGIKIHLGYFKVEIEAAKSYNTAAKKYFGKFAFLNVLT